MKQHWNAALYIRLSKGEDSQHDSIENQKKMLSSFVNIHEDEFSSVKYYVDSSITGVTSERLQFHKMLSDIDTGEIDCVIVKDPSRLSRNNYETGYYQEVLFVCKDVRFISLENPAVDSYRNPDLMNSILVPLHNMLNDDHCRQTSIKVKSVFDMKRRRGDYIGAFGPYGYIKDPNDRHRLLIDPEAALVVKNIFQWYLYENMTIQGIAKRLNSMGIPSPSVYKQQHTKYYNPHLNPRTTIWSNRTLGYMLANPVYLGHMVQGRHRVKSYKVQIIESIPKEDWIIVENTHRPIIDEDTFYKVQQLTACGYRRKATHKRPNTLAGLLKCADCERSVSRTSSRGYVYYRCRTYLASGPCTNHTIREDKLIAAVTSVAQLLISLSADYDFLSTSKPTPVEPQPLKKLQSKQKKQIEKDVQRIEQYQKSLYEDWKNGDINRKQYRQYKKEYAQDIKTKKEVLATLKEENSTTLKEVTTHNESLQHFLKTGELSVLPRQLLMLLIDSVHVNNKQEVTVNLTFADPFIQ